MDVKTSCKGTIHAAEAQLDVLTTAMGEAACSAEPSGYGSSPAADPPKHCSSAVASGCCCAPLLLSARPSRPPLPPGGLGSSLIRPESSKWKNISQAD